ncbi:hypothetical protein B0J13DRAFT_567772 [Dactylonectria estremocensis]|uniref:Uncharacterized protein n=1 Tax=Dactylonectria estremocensis TaxID=1079267 RepID=A0A9P9DJA5_9HYPO|nr:hypothetical protein B0J13DRAFT_567772 [Dactylonectria estremocensis]
MKWSTFATLVLILGIYSAAAAPTGKQPLQKRHSVMNCSTPALTRHCQNHLVARCNDQNSAVWSHEAQCYNNCRCFRVVPCHPACDVVENGESEDDEVVEVEEDVTEKEGDA